VVTGLGLLTPVGNTVEESWKNIIAGKSGIAPITVFDASGFSARISGSVKNFDATLYIKPKDQKKMDIFIHYGLAAGIQALDDSGIEVTDENLGFESIQAAVAGSGHFIDAPETMASMERDYYYPKLADRDEPIVWQEAGALDHWHRAKVKVEQLLQQQPSYLDPEIDLEIRQRYPILLA